MVVLLIRPTLSCVTGDVTALLVVRTLDQPSSTLGDATTNDDVIDNDNTINVIIVVVVVVVDVVVVVSRRPTDVKRCGTLQPATHSNRSVLV